MAYASLWLQPALANFANPLSNRALSDAREVATWPGALCVAMRTTLHRVASLFAALANTSRDNPTVIANASAALRLHVR